MSSLSDQIAQKTMCVRFGELVVNAASQDRFLYFLRSIVAVGFCGTARYVSFKAERAEAGKFLFALLCRRNSGCSK